MLYQNATSDYLFKCFVSFLFPVLNLSTKHCSIIILNDGIRTNTHRTNTHRTYTPGQIPTGQLFPLQNTPWTYTHQFFLFCLRVRVRVRVRVFPHISSCGGYMSRGYFARGLIVRWVYVRWVFVRWVFVRGYLS